MNQTPHNPFCNTPEHRTGVIFLTEIVPEIPEPYDFAERNLSVAKRNSSLGEVVGGEFQGDFIAGKHADAVAAQPAREMGQNYTVVFELDAEQPAREFF